MEIGEARFILLHVGASYHDIPRNDQNYHVNLSKSCQNRLDNDDRVSRAGGPAMRHEPLALKSRLINRSSKIEEICLSIIIIVRRFVLT